MKKIIIGLCLCICLCATNGMVVPAPQKIKDNDGNTVSLSITNASLYLENVPEDFLNFARERFYAVTGYKLLSQNVGSAKANSISVKLITVKRNGTYSLIIDKTGITLKGDKDGIYYGWFSLMNLLRDKQALAGKVKLPQIEIKDYPDVRLRGLALQWCFYLPEQQFMLDTVDALAQLKYNVIMPEFGRLLKSEKYPKLSNNSKIKKYLTRTEFREFLRRAKLNNLKVIPLLNSLGHGERSIAWPKPLGDGIDLREEENYKVLFGIVEEYIEDLKTTGLKPEYFHFGMDEASLCLLENSKKYKLSTKQLFYDHIMKVRAFCKSKGLKMIVWHDMLMSSKDPLFSRDMNYVHSDKANAWQIRKKLPRDIILQYWNYEPRNRYNTAYGLSNEGFEVWFMPWGGTSCVAQAKQINDLGGVIIGSTWIDSGYYNNRIPGKNSLNRCRWMQDAIVELAEFAWNTNNNSNIKGRKLKYDPALYFSKLYWNKAVNPNEVRYIPLHPSGYQIGSEGKATLGNICKKLNISDSNLSVKGVSFNTSSAAVLGCSKSGISNLNSLVPPLSIYVNGKKITGISGVNKIRGPNQVILYTKEFGSQTGTNGFGCEVIVKGSKGIGKTAWGVGSSLIPGNGFVISGHGKGYLPIARIPINAKVTIKDINKKKLEISYGSSEASKIKYQVKRKIKNISLLHFTVNEADFNALIADMRVVYSDGSKKDIQLRYGCDVGCYKELFFPFVRPKNIVKWPALYNSNGKNASTVIYGWEWTNSAPKKEVDYLEITVDKANVNIGYGILGASAGITK